MQKTHAFIENAGIPRRTWCLLNIMIVPTNEKHYAEPRMSRYATEE